MTDPYSSLPKLPPSFYQRDVLTVSRELLGKLLVAQSPEGRVIGRIVETEAYRGHEDKAAHSFRASPDGRTSVMYEAGGRAYVYLIYGMYCCFNIVADKKDVPHAVLIRALEPVDNLPLMYARRKQRPEAKPAVLCSGPGKLCQAMGISLSLYGEDLTGSRLYLLDPGAPPPNIIATPRINIDYAEEAKNYLYRFVIPDSPFLSKKLIQSKTP